VRNLFNNRINGFFGGFFGAGEFGRGGADSRGFSQPTDIPLCAGETLQKAATV
jgi:hypothetical protein